MFKDFFQVNGFLFPALMASVLASVACGMVGSYVVVKRCSYMVGAISHSLLGGIGLSCFCHYKFSHCGWITPFVGSLFAALLASVIVTVLANSRDSRQDTILSAVWTLGAALGLTFVYAIPGYPVDLNSYLFGEILLVSNRELLLMGCLDAILLVLLLLCYNRFLFFCFNEEGLRLRGVNVWFTGLTLNLMIAVTVVLLSQIVGLILCLALLILPVATVSAWCRKLPMIMLLSSLLCLLTAALGLAVGNAADLPPGTLIVEISGFFYFLSTLLNRLFCRRKV